MKDDVSRVCERPEEGADSGSDVGKEFKELKELKGKSGPTLARGRLERDKGRGSSASRTEVEDLTVRAVVEEEEYLRREVAGEGGDEEEVEA